MKPLYKDIGWAGIFAMIAVSITLTVGYYFSVKACYGGNGGPSPYIWRVK